MVGADNAAREFVFGFMCVWIVCKHSNWKTEMQPDAEVRTT